MDQAYKISVVMPTYNGESNIEEQLDSLRNQSYSITELIIKDDGSTDDTLSIVQSYIQKYNLKNWKIIKNEKNMGWRQNFFSALNYATGDLIFPSDQDDIWDINKIKNIVNFFKTHPNAQVVVSDYDELIEPGGTSYPCSKRKIKNLGEDNQIKFNKKNIYLNRPGWVYAIRKPFLKEVNTYAKTAIVPVHDIAMWSTAVLTDTLYYLDIVTGKWRKHGHSAIRVENGRDEKNGGKAIRLGKLNRLKEITISNISFLKNTNFPIKEKERKKRILEKLIEEYNVRMKIINQGKIRNVYLNIFKYTSFHPIVADTMFLIKNKKK